MKNAYILPYGVMKAAAPPASFSVDQIVDDVKKRIEHQRQGPTR